MVATMWTACGKLIDRVFKSEQTGFWQFMIVACICATIGFIAYLVSQKTIFISSQTPIDMQQRAIKPLADSKIEYL